jgi:sulfate permease, SulP family
MALGFDFLYDWVIEGWKRFTKAEYAGVLLILVVIVVTDYLTGVLVGLLAMVVLFAIGYSRTRVILLSYSAGEVLSTVDRPEADNRLLQEKGSEALVYELQGFLFFGTANVLLDALKQRMNQAGLPAPAIMLVDFRAVTGLDSSAALSFQKTAQLAQEKGMEMVLTGASEQARERLDLDRLDASSQQVRMLTDLDHGLEWCEDRVLARHANHGPDPLPAEAARQASISELLASRAARYGELHEMLQGDILFRRGDPAESLYFLLSGQVSVLIQSGEGEMRLRTMGPGCCIGELALYLNQPRSADVRIDAPSCVLSISQAALEHIRQQDPGLSADLHAFIVRQLSRRIIRDERNQRVFKR